MDETDDKNVQSESLKPLLEQLLASKSERLVIKANDKGKNRFMWSHFDIAYLDGKEQQYACCKYCKGFVKYTGRTGTGGLMRHFCYKQFLNQRVEKEAQPSPEAANSAPANSPLTPTPQDPDKIPLRLQIETLIAQKSPRIGYIYNYKGKSGVWSQFYMITLDNAVVNFACCIACHSIVTYVSRTGTGSMTRHKCQNNSSYRKFIKNIEHEDFKPSARKKRKFSQEENNEEEDEDPLELKPEENWEDKQIKEEVEEMIPEEDGIPPETEKMIREKHFACVKKSFDLLEMFQNEQFLDFAQTLVDLGAQYGRFDLRKILKGKKDFSELFRRTE